MTKFEYHYRITLDDGLNINIIRPEPIKEITGVWIWGKTQGGKCTAGGNPICIKGSHVMIFELLDKKEVSE